MLLQQLTWKLLTIVVLQVAAVAAPVLLVKPKLRKIPTQPETLPIPHQQQLKQQGAPGVLLVVVVVEVVVMEVPENDNKMAKDPVVVGVEKR